MTLSHTEYRRTTVNLLPNQELFVTHEAEKRHTTKRQVIIDLIAIGQKVAQGQEIDELYGNQIRQTMLEVGELNSKEIKKEIHESLFKTLYKALNDKIKFTDKHILALNLMMATFLYDVRGGDQVEGNSVESIYEEFVLLAEKMIDKRNEKKQLKERD